jgi:hypothetical protein
MVYVVCTERWRVGGMDAALRQQPAAQRRWRYRAAVGTRSGTVRWVYRLASPFKACVLLNRAVGMLQSCFDLIGDDIGYRKTLPGATADSQYYKIHSCYCFFQAFRLRSEVYLYQLCQHMCKISARATRRKIRADGCDKSRAIRLRTLMSQTDWTK